MRTQIPCKTCDAGELKKRKKYRMSGIVVFIGYILLIPSIIGMAGSALGIAATGSATEQTASAMQREARTKLRAADITAAIAERVATQQVVAAGDMNGLSDVQRQAIQDTRLEMAAGTLGVGAGAALFGGASLMLGVMSLVGGLLGWLLVMKKAVLQCNSCGAVVAAS
jgi:hypothetical protein